jgi:hypothetical protein
MGNYLRAIPLMLIPAALYGALVLTVGEPSLRPFLAETLFSMMLPSGAEWVVTRGYGLVILAAGCLFIEIIKSTRPTGSAIAENILAFLSFAGFIVLFLLIPSFGTIEFFLIMIMTLLDFLAGAIVMIFVARRDVALGN